MSGLRADLAPSLSAMAAMEARGSSYADASDPATTNIHVHPLPANVTELSLGTFFARFGSVATVKIMWPRDEGGPASGAGAGMNALRRAKQSGLGGFVAMMDRKSAEKAFKELDGFDWGGCVLRLGWGKSMPLPPRPAFGSSLL